MSDDLTKYNKTGYIAAVARGHNAGVCLLKDGKIVFSIEEERLSRKKYDGGPLASMVKILDYTDTLDYLVIAHTQPLDQAGTIDFTGENMYTGLARKLGLIDRKKDIYNHPQVIDMSHMHHKLHSSCAFFRSGFKSAVSVIVDGAGTFIPMNIEGEDTITWELETIIDCAYPDKFTTLYKHQGGRGPWASTRIPNFESKFYEEEGTHELVIDESAGIVKAYEAVTQYCGWAPIEAGKTMGLFPYGSQNLNIPDIYTNYDGMSDWSTTNRDLIVPTYPNGAVVNQGRFTELRNPPDLKKTDELVVNLSFDTESMNNFFYSKGISYADISKTNLVLFPVLIEDDNFYFFLENYFFNNWNDENKEKNNEFIDYILPVENLEDIQLIKNSEDNLELINIKEILSGYDIENYIFLIIKPSERKINVFLKGLFSENKIIKNFEFDIEDKNRKFRYKETIRKIKQEIDEVWAVWYPSHKAFLGLKDVPTAAKSFTLKRQVVERAVIHRCDPY